MATRTNPRLQSSMRTKKSPAFYNRIFFWLSSFSSIERQFLFTKTDLDFVHALIYMLQRRNSLFRPTSKNSSLLETNIAAYTVSYSEGISFKGHKKEAEDFLVSQLRLFHSGNSLDSFTVIQDLVENTAKLMSCIKCVLNDKCFTSEVSRQYHKWCSMEIGHTLGEWIAVYLEQLLIERYSILYMKTKDYVNEFFAPLRAPFNDYEGLIEALREEHDKVGADLENPLDFFYFIPLEAYCPELANQIMEMRDKRAKGKGLADALLETLEQDQGDNKQEIQNEMNHLQDEVNAAFVSKRTEEKAAILEKLMQESALELSEEGSDSSQANSKKDEKAIYHNDTANAKDGSSKPEAKLSNPYQETEKSWSVIKTTKIVENHEDLRLVVKTPHLEYLHQAQFFSDLEQEIEEEVAKISSHAKLMFENAQSIKDQLESIAKEVFSDKNVYCAMFGSLATGLALETSDLDIAICGLFIPSKVVLIKLMALLAETLKTKPFVETCQVIETARVPVIKLKVKTMKQRMKVDVTLDDSSENELSSVRYGIKFVEWVREKSAQLPYLKPLVLLLKKLVSIHGLNIPFYGGISSYVLTLMISSFLRICPMCPTIAYAFAEALRYYGDNFDPNRMIVDRGEIIRLELVEISKNSDVLVVDPFRPGVNAASTLTRFAEIKELFSSSHRYLFELAMGNAEEQKEGEILKGIYKEVVPEVITLD